MIRHICSHQVKDRIVSLYADTATGFFEVTLFDDPAKPLNIADLQAGTKLALRKHKSVLCMSWQHAEEVYKWCIASLIEVTA